MVTEISIASDLHPSNATNSLTANFTSTVSSKLFPTKKNNPCPVCENTTGKCRIRGDQNFVLCVDNASEPVGSIINGFKATGLAKKDPRWMCFNREKDAYYYSNISKGFSNAFKPKKVVEPVKTYLTPDERHEGYSRLLSVLKLDDDHRENLLGRGFTLEEIERECFRTVEPNQELPDDIDPRLPGIKLYKDKKQISVASRAIASPIKNYDGKIVAFQLRLSGATDNKYRWLSTPQSELKLNVTSNSLSSMIKELGNIPGIDLKISDNLEMPLSVDIPEKPQKIVLTEGTSFKPKLASRKLKAIAIGASGNQHSKSPKQLLSIIYQARKDFGDLPIVFCPDAGANKQITNLSLDTFELLRGYLGEDKIFFEWHDQYKKGDKDKKNDENKDIDELPDNYKFRQISPAQYFKKVRHFVTEKFSLPYERDHWLESHKFATKESERQDSQYLEKMDLPDAGTITLINAGMGAGKTEIGIDLGKQGEAQGIYTHVFTPRNKINDQFENRAGEKGWNLTQLRKEDAIRLACDEQVSTIGCAESMHKLSGNLKDKQIMIDEVSTLLGQIIEGKTMADSASLSRCVETFEEALKVSRNVICFDANLNDYDVEFLEKVSGKRVVRIHNTNTDAQFSQPIKMIDVIGSSKNELLQRDRSAVLKIILEAKRPFVVSDSQKELEAYASEIIRLSELETEPEKKRCFITLDKLASNETSDELLARRPDINEHFERKGIPGFRTDNYAKEFTENPDDFLTYYRFDGFFGSPTVESGFSVTVNKKIPGFFDTLVLIYFGVVSVKSASQLLGRLRINPEHSIPCYVFCPKTSMTPTTLSDSCNPYDVAKHLRERALENINLEDLSEDALKLLARRDQEILEQLSHWMPYRSKFISDRNFEKKHLRDCLEFLLRQNGYRVDSEEKQSDQELKQVIKDRRTENRARDLEAKWSSEAVVDNETGLPSIRLAAEKYQQTQKTVDYNRLEKTKLVVSFPDIIDYLTPLEKLDRLEKLDLLINHKEYTKAQDFYILLHNQELAAKRREFNIVNNFGFGYNTDRDFLKSDEVLLGILRKIDVQNFLKYIQEENEEGDLIKLTEDCEEVEKLVKSIQGIKGLSNGSRMTLSVPSTRNKKTNIDCVKAVLGLIGVKLKKPSRKEASYVFDKESFNDPFRKKVLEIRAKYFKDWEENTYLDPSIAYTLMNSNNGVLDKQLKDEWKSIAKGNNHDENYYKSLPVSQLPEAEYNFTVPVKQELESFLDSDTLEFIGSEDASKIWNAVVRGDETVSPILNEHELLEKLQEKAQAYLDACLAEKAQVSDNAWEGDEDYEKMVA